MKYNGIDLSKWGLVVSITTTRTTGRRHCRINGRVVSYHDACIAINRERAALRAAATAGDKIPCFHRETADPVTPNGPNRNYEVYGFNEKGLKK